MAFVLDKGFKGLNFFILCVPEYISTTALRLLQIKVINVYFLNTLGNVHQHFVKIISQIRPKMAVFQNLFLMNPKGKHHFKS